MLLNKLSKCESSCPWIIAQTNSPNEINTDGMFETKQMFALTVFFFILSAFPSFRDLFYQQKKNTYLYDTFEKYTIFFYFVFYIHFTEILLVLRKSAMIQFIFKNQNDLGYYCSCCLTGNNLDLLFLFSKFGLRKPWRVKYLWFFLFVLEQTLSVQELTCLGSLLITE